MIAGRGSTDTTAPAFTGLQPLQRLYPADIRAGAVPLMPGPTLRKFDLLAIAWPFDMPMKRLVAPQAFLVRGFVANHALPESSHGRHAGPLLITLISPSRLPPACSFRRPSVHPGTVDPPPARSAGAIFFPP